MLDIEKNDKKVPLRDKEQQNPLHLLDPPRSETLFKRKHLMRRKVLYHMGDTEKLRDLPLMLDETLGLMLLLRKETHFCPANTGRPSL